MTFILIVVGIICFLANALYHIKKAGPSPYLTLRNNDLYSWYLPQLVFAKRSILSGSIPLWNPYQAVGRPFFAVIWSALLYPFTWLIFVADVPFAMLAIQILDTVVAMVGTIIFMRYLKLEWPGIILAVVLSGYATFSETFNLAMGSTYCWLPIVLWLLHRLFDRPTFFRCTALSASLVVCFLGGYTQHFYYFCLVIFVYSFVIILFSWKSYQSKGVILRLVLAMLAFIVMFGLVSVQLFPTIELSLYSVRNIAQHLDPGADPYSRGFSLILLKNYLVKSETSISGPHFYFGSSLLFVPLALASKRQRQVVAALLACCVFTIFFISSQQIPMLAVLGRITFSDVFRGHIRMLPICYPMMGALAGIGLDSFWEKAPVTMWSLKRMKLDSFWSTVVIYTFIIACLIYLTLVVAWVKHSLSYLVVFLPSLSLILAYTLYLLNSDCLPLGIRQLGAWVIMVMIILDVAVNNEQIEYTTPASNWQEILKRASTDRRIEWINRNAGYDRALVPNVLFTLSFNLNPGSMFQFFSINSYDPLTLSRWQNYLQFMMGAEEFRKFMNGRPFYGDFEKGFWQESLLNPRMLGLTSLRYILTTSPVKEGFPADPETGWTLIGNNADQNFYVYQNRFAVPHAYLVNNYISVRNEGESLQAIGEHITDLAHSVVLENARPSFPSSLLSTKPGETHISKYGINKVEMNVEAREPALVVLTDAYYPGWHAYVDGIRKPIWRANSLFRAVEVTPGSHKVVFKYEPASFKWGLTVTVTTILFMLIGLLFRTVFERKMSCQKDEV